MSRAAVHGSYLVISPVKDEARHVETTIRAVVNQTVRPALWIIVDDGSTDATPEILARSTATYDWIHVLRIDRDQTRLPGAGVIRAFNEGYRTVSNSLLDFVVKLDCDLDLPEDYFRQLLTKFHQDPRLGIASGLCLEKGANGWHPTPSPPYHARGASKMVRAKCFADIGGFVPSKGWDTLDEIRAQTLGWRTCHFEEPRFYHLKPEGVSIGFSRSNAMFGEIYHLTGGGLGFFLLKVTHRMLFGKPFLLGGAAMLWGFLRARVSGTKRLVSESEARFYRRLLNGRIWEPFGQLLRRRRSKNQAWSVS